MEQFKTTKSPIDEFAEIIISLPNEIVAGALKSTENEDAKSIAKAYLPVLTKQFGAIGNLLNERSGMLSPEVARQTEDLLRVTAGIELAHQARKLAENLTSFVSRIGIVGIVQMIKKVIRWLLELIFGSLPNWLDKLLDIIDEILNEIFGVESPRLASVLSQKEQNYLSELAKLAILNREESYNQIMKNNGESGSVIIGS